MLRKQKNGGADHQAHGKRAQVDRAADQDHDVDSQRRHAVHGLRDHGNVVGERGQHAVVADFLQMPQRRLDDAPAQAQPQLEVELTVSPQSSICDTSASARSPRTGP